jgi:hypothetical protein
MPFRYFEAHVSYVPAGGGKFAHIMKAVAARTHRDVEDLALTTVMDLYPGCEITGILVVETKADWQDILHAENDLPPPEPEGETRGITL